MLGVEEINGELRALEAQKQVAMQTLERVEGAQQMCHHLLKKIGDKLKAEDEAKEPQPEQPAA